MADPAVPERREPVFRLVADTTSFSQVDRFRLAEHCKMLDPFVPAAAGAWSQN